MTKVLLTHESGLRKEIKCGFSWTVFFFGFLVPLVRGDIKWAVIMAFLQIAIGTFTVGIGAWVVGFVFCFTYNKLYIKELLQKGYRPDTEEEKSKLVDYNIY